MHYITAMSNVGTAIAIACRCGKLIVVYADSANMHVGWERHLNDVDTHTQFTYPV